MPSHLPDGLTPDKVGRAVDIIMLAARDGLEENAQWAAIQVFNVFAGLPVDLSDKPRSTNDADG